MVAATEGRSGLRTVAFTLATALLAVNGCSDPLVNPEEAAAARAHLESVLDVMETNSINRNTIDWASFKSTVRAAAPDPKQLGDTFEAIHLALVLLGDHHSRYVAPHTYGVTIRDSTITCTAPAASQADVPPDVGYVRVRAFSGSGTAAIAYANQLHVRIRAQDIAADVAGWIVDLRGNSGGSMWPMIAGIGPILGEGIVGWFIDPDGVESRWEYRGGLSILHGTTITALASPYTVKNVDPKIAVLTDGNVASSGEAVAVAFRARPDTRFFGTPTCGLSTANSSFVIDDALLILTVAHLADRNKVTYGDALPPDEVITDETELIQRAVAWLRGS